MGTFSTFLLPILLQVKGWIARKPCLLKNVPPQGFVLGCWLDSSSMQKKKKKVWEEKDFQLPLSAVLSQAIAPTKDGFYISGFIFAFTNRTFLSGMRSVKAKPAVRFNSRELSAFCHRNIFLLPKRVFYVPFSFLFFCYVCNWLQLNEVQRLQSFKPNSTDLHQS